MDNRSVNFSKSVEKMIKKNISSWDEFYGRRRFQHIRIYTLEDVERILQSGNLDELQRISLDFYLKDGLYRRILLYQATLLKFAGILIPQPSYGKKLSDSFVQKKQYAALDQLDVLNIPELFTRITLRVLIDGCYYGVIQSVSKDEFVLIDLPAAYCRSRYRDFKGNDVVELNVSFFDKMEEDVRQTALQAYPKAIASYYRKWREGKVTSTWLKIPGEIGVCFPFFDDGRPLFLNVIPATMQYDDAVDLELERELDDIRKIIVQKIPHLTDGQLLFEPPEAEVMHEGAVGMLSKNQNLSVLTTYADVEAIISKTSSENINNSLDRMLQNVYAETGASSLLFAPTGTQALSTSITNDMSLMMVLANKYSRFISFILTNLFGNSNISFKYSILPISYYNQSDFITDALKMAQSGYSFLLPSVAIGLNQKDLINVKELENSVLDLTSILIPLSSSYTQSSNEVGAPEKKLEDKAPKTIQNEDSINRQGGFE